MIYPDGRALEIEESLASVDGEMGEAICNDNIDDLVKALALSKEPSSSLPSSSTAQRDMVHESGLEAGIFTTTEVHSIGSTDDKSMDKDSAESIDKVGLSQGDSSSVSHEEIVAKTNSTIDVDTAATNDSAIA